MTEQQTTGKKREYKKLPELDLAGAKFGLVSQSVVADRRKSRESKPRSKSQIALDTLVQRVYEKWVGAGKPSDFAQRPGGQVVVSESQLLTVKRTLANSGAHLGMSVRFCQDVVSNSGNVEIVFAVSDRTERKPREKKS